MRRQLTPTPLCCAKRGFLPPRSARLRHRFEGGQEPGFGPHGGRICVPTEAGFVSSRRPDLCPHKSFRVPSQTQDLCPHGGRICVLTEAGFVSSQILQGYRFILPAVYFLCFLPEVNCAEKGGNIEYRTCLAAGRQGTRNVEGK
jgi:hypothetical protein